MAAPSQSVFHAAVERTLSSWTALQLAVQQGFGGAESEDKAQWFVDAIDQWFQENADIEVYELEDFLTDILNNEFDTIADDGSLRQVATNICGYFRMCAGGRQEEVMAKIQTLPTADLRQCQVVQAQVNDDGDDDDDDDDDGGGGPPNLVGEEMDCAEAHSTPHTVPQHADNTASTHDQMESEEMPEDDGWTVVNKKAKKR